MQETAFPTLRASLAAEYVDVSDEQFDAIVAEVYGSGVLAEDVEGFLNDIGRGFQSVGHAVGNFAQQAAPVVGHALPSIAQGAITGATVGGPIGALVGGVAGGAGGILSQSRDPRLRGIGSAIGTAGQLASTIRCGGAFGNLANIALGALGQPGGGLGQVAGVLPQFAGGLGAGRGIGGAVAGLTPHIASIATSLGQAAPGSSANALMGLLSRPEITQALLSAALGAFGRPNVMVGTQPVPVQSILSALGTLAGHAAREAERASGEALPAYFYGQDGELAIDPADADQRTDALLALLALTAPRWAGGPRASDELFPDRATPEYTAEDADADAWLMAEAAWSENEEEESYA